MITIKKPQATSGKKYEFDSEEVTKRINESNKSIAKALRRNRDVDLSDRKLDIMYK